MKENYFLLCCLSAINLVVSSDKMSLNFISKLALDNGYPLDEHFGILSEDGYYLNLHRIPYGHGNKHVKNKPPILLVHGIISTPEHYMLNGVNKSLAFMLADEGYDVWLMSNRGNGHSRRHQILDPDEGKDFWKYSWHEIGIYDLPAVIDYILKVTRHKQLQYIGHSQGCTTFFVMTSMRPEYNEKIKLMSALAPVVYFKHSRHPAKNLDDLISFVMKVLWNFGIYEIILSDDAIEQVIPKLCNMNEFFKKVCGYAVFLSAGYNSPQFNATFIDAVFQAKAPGDSIMQYVHYLQGFKTGHFAQYVPDTELDDLQYAEFKHYPLEKVTAPVALYYSGNDLFTYPKDVSLLHRKISNPVLLYEVADKHFNHFDFLFAIDVRPLIYDPVLDLIKKYT